MKGRGSQINARARKLRLGLAGSQFSNPLEDAERGDMTGGHP